MRKSLFAAACALSFAACSTSTFCADREISPYGVVAHLSRWEFDDALREFELMKAAGIKSFRCDFDWSAVERNRGEFDFSKWDRIIAMSEASGIEPLPIFPGAVPRFADPLPLHPDEASESAARIVPHFKGKIKYWEITNEPNHPSFWKGAKPDGKAYAELLAKISASIRKADPDAKILFAGVAGVPLEYIEAAFAAGAGKHFDIMNVHPYSWMQIQEDVFAKKIDALKALMAKYGIADKPIWITEIGYSSATAAPSVTLYVARALKMLGLESAPAAYISDDKYAYYSEGTYGALDQILPDPRKKKRVGFDKLAGLSPEKYPVLYIPPTESFPRKYLPALLEYVGNGGTLVTAGGMPFYYDLEISPNGEVRRSRVGADGAEMLHISTLRTSEKETAPYLSDERHFIGTLKKLESAEGFEDIPADAHFKPYFLTAEKLGENDKMIPIAYGFLGDKKLPVAAIYKLGGAFKGNVIVVLPPTDAVATEEMQARMLARTYMLSRAAGIERIYKYCLRDNERDYTRESHFGIVRKDLSPKPAYAAYKTFVEMLGGATPKIVEKNGVHLASWKNADGAPAYAIWTNMYRKKTTLDIRGAVKSACGLYGENRDWRGLSGKCEVRADGAITYFTGPQSVGIAD